MTRLGTPLPPLPDRIVTAREAYQRGLTHKRPIHNDRFGYDPKKIRARLDALTRQATLARDRHQCVRCRGTSHLQCAHMFTRTATCIRWRLENTMTLCAGCHLWWHKHPILAAEWAKEYYGEERVLMLRLALRERKKVDLVATELHLLQVLEGLGATEQGTG